MALLPPKKRIYLSSPHMSGNEYKYINEAFKTNWVAPLGPNVDAFEREIALYTGANDAVAVSSGTAAIHLALSLLEIGKGDSVFCSSLTFVASANPILYQGAQPVFIDSEPETWNMSPLALEKAFEDGLRSGMMPKAVIIVHLYGQSAKMDELLSICDHYSVPVIEDSAESLGTTYKGQSSGTHGRFGVFSFNGNKIITTSGGGVLVSNDAKALNKARFLSTQAKDKAPHYQHSQTGYNYRLSNILAGIGRAQLEVLDKRVKARRRIFNYYFNELSDIPGVQFMPELQNTHSNRWLTTLTIDPGIRGFSTESILNSLEVENIEARPIWKPLHLQPLFSGTKYYKHDDDVSSEIFQTGLCLPSGSNMTEEDQERVVDCIKKLFKEKARVKNII